MKVESRKYVLLLSCVACVALRGHADTHFVDVNCATPVSPFTNWTTAATAIQDAVDVAEDGDTVKVAEGLYDRGGRPVVGQTTNRVSITRAITVQSEKCPLRTIIVGRSPLEGGVRCVGLSTNAVLDGFTLANGGAAVVDGDEWNTRGGGAFCAKEAVIKNCVVTGCVALCGGGVYGGQIYNTVAYGNQAYTGGGVCSGVLTHCTLMGNLAFQSGGGTYGGCATNSIVYHNSARAYPNWDGTLFCHSDTEPLPLGPGNSAQRPGVLGLDNPHIVSNSPCRDVAYPLIVFGETDIDGEVRPSGLLADVGADEYTEAGITGALAVAIDAPFLQAVTGFELEFTSRITGRAAGFGWCVDGVAAEGTPSIVRSWPAPSGAHMIVLSAWNNDCRVAATVSVTVVTGYTNYVSTTGGSLFPYADWNRAATSLQVAVDAMPVVGGTTLVAPGTYDAGTYRTRYMLNRVGIYKPMTLKASASDPHDTVILGQGPLGTNAVRCAYITAGGRLEGFTLTGGATRDAGQPGDGELAAGGVFCDGNGVVSNCIITGNQAYEGGGGTHGGKIFDSAISQNSAGKFGGGSIGGSLFDCVIRGNEATYGGGSCDGVLERCVLSDNRASPASAYGYGGGSYMGTLRNCLMYQNYADFAGGSCYSRLEQCTVAENLGVYYVGGCLRGSADNSIVMSNQAIYYSSTATFNYMDLVCNYSCVQPLPAGGKDNVSADPLFVDPLMSNYRLQPFSPCIDSGNNGDEMVETYDLRGRPRIRNGTVDMGAYEFVFAADMKGMLQGPYCTNVHAMMSAVGTNLPSRSPYAANARAFEKVPSNAVDWAMVEVQDTNRNTIAIASVLLDPQGRAYDPDGATNIPVEVSAGTYYLALRHRNHLSAMSAQPVAFTNTVVSYDFTTGPDKYFGGTNACVELEPGVWGLIGGDADGDGRITPTDREIVRRQKGMTGYLQGDLNLDGKVDGRD